MSHDKTLIVSDLDGTLLRSDKSLSDRSRRALIAARGVGMRTAAASARPLRLVDQVINDASVLFDALILSNGAAVIDPADRRTLYESRLSVQDATRIIDLVRSRWPTVGFGWELGTHFIGDATFVKLSLQADILRDPVAEDVASLPLTGVHQLVFAVPGITPADILTQVARMIGDDYWVTDSNGGVIEVSTAAVTKAEGARWWAQSLGLTMENVVAFGDELNDVPLLQAAGRGYAMAGAIPSVQASAGCLAAGNDEDGVARIVEELVTRNGPLA